MVFWLEDVVGIYKKSYLNTHNSVLYRQSGSRKAHVLSQAFQKAVFADKTKGRD